MGKKVYMKRSDKTETLMERIDQYNDEIWKILNQDLTAAQNLAKKLSELLKKESYPAGYGRFLVNKGWIFLTENYYHQALETLMESIEIMQQLKIKDT